MKIIKISYAIKHKAEVHCRIFNTYLPSHIFQDQRWNSQAKLTYEGGLRLLSFLAPLVQVCLQSEQMQCLHQSATKARSNELKYLPKNTKNKKTTVNV